jgi:hypothetical protein
VEISEVRRRLLGALEKARHDAAERRARVDLAARDYEAFLSQRAAPVFHQLAAALKAEGHQFNVFTPAASIRLAAARSPEEFIELFLDDSSNPPMVVGKVTRGRGRTISSSERPLKDGAGIADLTDEDVLVFLLEEIPRLIER